MEGQVNTFNFRESKCVVLDDGNLISEFLKENSKFSRCIEAQKHSKTARLCKRTSRLSRAVINHIVEHYDSLDPDYVVFSSRFGELEFIEQNIESNTAFEELSPTIFSHSVHNAISCLYSIIRGIRVPTNSLCPSGNIIANAAVDAVCYLLTRPSANEALVVCYDGYIPDRYRSTSEDTAYGYVVTFTIRREDGGLSLESIQESLQSCESELSTIQYLNSVVNA